jgi:hypothetical protein
MAALLCARIVQPEIPYRDYCGAGGAALSSWATAVTI